MEPNMMLSKGSSIAGWSPPTKTPAARYAANSRTVAVARAESCGRAPNTAMPCAARAGRARSATNQSCAAGTALIRAPAKAPPTARCALLGGAQHLPGKGGILVPRSGRAQRLPVADGQSVARQSATQGEGEGG